MPAIYYTVSELLIHLIPFVGDGLLAYLLQTSYSSCSTMLCIMRIVLSTKWTLSVINWRWPLVSF